MRSKITRVLGLMLCLGVPVHAAWATTFHVDCTPNSTSRLTSINAALTRAIRSESNTIVVSGPCVENVSITSVDSLTIIANPGASITDASGGTNYVISILDSHSIAISGFTVIGGGGAAIVCGSNSTCNFSGNTVQNANGDGLLVSNGSGANSNGDTFQNCAGRGLVVQFAAHVIVQGSAFSANGVTFQDANIRLRNHASLVLRNVTVQGAGFYGVRLTDHSTLEMLDSVITNNVSGGVSLETSSEASFDPSVTGNSITANPGGGVLVFDVSLAHFIDSGTPVKDTISGNGSTDVICAGGHAFAVGLGNLSAGSTTTCTAP